MPFFAGYRASKAGLSAVDESPRAEDESPRAELAPVGVRPVEILPVRAIVDAIEDPPSPLRVACDPMGAALLEAWRAGSDEESIAGCLAVFDVGGAQSARPSRT